MSKLKTGISTPEEIKKSMPARVRQRSKPNWSISLKTDKDVEITPTASFELMIELIDKSILNPDFSQAIKNAQNTANTKYQVEFSFPDNMSDERKVKLHDQMMDELDNFRRNCYPSANCHIFINDCIAALQRTGAVCAEWVPKIGLDGIEKVVVVPSQLCRWFRTPRGNIVLRQKIPYVIDNKNMKEHVTLNTTTTMYRGLALDNGNPYGTPPFLSVLKPIQTQEHIFDGVKDYTKKINPMGFLTVLFRKPSKYASETPAAYQARLNNLLDDMYDRYKDGFENGIAVGYKDEWEISKEQTSEGGRNLAAINQLNEEQLMSSLNQDPALAGRTYSTTETYAGVVYDKYLNGMNAIQSILADILSLGFRLHLQLRGFPVLGVKITFSKAKSLTNKTDAEADFVRQKVQHELYSDGITSQQDYANAMGKDKPDQSEPRYPYASDQETLTALESDVKQKENKNGERQTRGDKEKGIKKPEPRTNR